MTKDIHVPLRETPFADHLLNSIDVYLNLNATKMQEDEVQIECQAIQAADRQAWIT